MKRFLRVGTVLGIAACFAPRADAAMMAYLYITGQKSGQVKGGIIQKGREDSIGVIAVSHSIVSPRDPQSGLPTGQRMHKPFIITKELDKSSPVLNHILATNETLSKVELRFWTPQLKAASGVGSEVQMYTVKLTNANIASIDFRMANVRHPDMVKFAEYEEIAFTYQKIEWTWIDGGVTAQDDWAIRGSRLPSGSERTADRSPARLPEEKPASNKKRVATTG